MSLSYTFRKPEASEAVVTDCGILTVLENGKESSTI